MTLVKIVLAVLLVALMAGGVSAGSCQMIVVTDKFSHQSGLFTGGYLHITEYPLGVSHNEYTRSMMEQYVCAMPQYPGVKITDVVVMGSDKRERYHFYP